MVRFKKMQVRSGGKRLFDDYFLEIPKIVEERTQASVKEEKDLATSKLHGSLGLPWWSSGSQCRGPRFDPWSRK